jgi:hypothetical protein
MNPKTMLLVLTLAASAQAQPLKVATWNLGWHLDTATAKTWIAACSRPFALQDGTWKPAAQAGEGTQVGWTLPWGRNAPVEWDIGVLPPCDVYQANRAVVPVTEAAYAERAIQIGRFIREQIAPDVIAFQEVNGAKAIRELLGPGWEVCGYEGHKVQRLAFAWKASLGAGRCEVNWPLSLPERPMREQVRPGLALKLTVDGKAFSLLTVHLKSSCVTPMDERKAEGRGQLDGDDPHCRHLQAQVQPLEAWLDAELKGSERLVMLGDFNRNLTHEAAESSDAAVRSGERTRNLWRELNDGDPKALTLLGAQCEGNLCSLGKTRPLARDEYGQLRQQLGCRNPLGLDHIVIAGQLSSPAGAQKVALGELANTVVTGDKVQLGLSDHCPVQALIIP